MHIRYFDDKHNRDLVSEVMVTFESTRISSMIMALPTAMTALIENMPRLPKSENSDFEADEIHRQALNRVIQLADLLEEFMRLSMEQKLITPGFNLMEPYYWEAVTAFDELQKCKSARIAITHRDLGDLHGSRTGFQEMDYSKFAREISSWVVTKHQEYYTA